MKTFLFHHVPTFCLIPFLLILSNLPVHAFETEPHPLDTFLDTIVDFQKPTAIRGTLRYIEVEEEIIWLNWDQRSDARPLFSTDWKFVPGEATLAVHPTDTIQFQELRQLEKGTSLQLIIQDNGKGHRHILSFQNLTFPPKVPL